MDGDDRSKRKKIGDYGNRDELFSHPVYKSLVSVGFGDEAQWMRTFLVYLDLIESKGWYDVQLCPVGQLQTVLVSGCPSKNKEASYILASSLDATSSMAELQVTINTVKELFKSSRLLMAYVDSDSSIVYYSLTDSLVPPERPEHEQTERQKRKMHRKKPNFVVRGADVHFNL